VADLATYTSRVQAAQTAQALNAILKPVLVAVAPPPPTPSDPTRGWKEAVEGLLVTLKRLEKSAKVDFTEGVCKLSGVDSEELHTLIGHHDTCGCEDGVLTVHGQQTRLPASTRVISQNTSMSNIINSLAEDEVLEIDHGVTLRYDVLSDRKIRAIIVYGALQFATDRNTRVLVGDLIVPPTGRLTVGTEQEPIGDAYKSEIVFASYPLNRETDPYQLGIGLIAMGDVEIFGKRVNLPGIAPVTAPKAQDRSITLKDLPEQSGWRVGDTIVLADTRQLAKMRNLEYASQTEYRKIIAINGPTITLDQPLSYDHPGFKLPNISGALAIDKQIEVINVTRSVIIRSESPSATTRAHTMFTDQARVNIQYATFQDLGRSIDGELDNTECDKMGRVRNYGFNPAGRYALHLHHLRGPNNPTNTGYQFKLVGDTFEGSLRWALAVHNTSFGSIAHNVFHRNPGTALAFEDGDEAETETTKNWFVATAPGYDTLPETLITRGGRTRDSDTGKLSFHGSIAIWDSPSGTVKDNRIYGHYAVGYELNEYYDGSIRTPKFRGAALDDANAWINWGAKRNDSNNRTAAVPVGQKSDNIIVGSLLAFYEAWPRATVSRRGYAEIPTVFDRFIMANVQEGVHAYHTSNSEYRDFVMVNDPKVGNDYSGGSRYTTAFNLSNPHYESANIKITSENANAVIANSEGAADADGVYAGTYISNFHIGVDFARNSDQFGAIGDPENLTTIIGGRWENYVNFKINLATDKTARVARISDVALFSPGGMKQILGFPQRPLSVLMDFSILPYGVYSNVLTRDRVFINGWSLNGVRAPDYRVYYLQQDPDFVVPVSSDLIPRVLGATEPGLTNEQHRLKYGTSIADAIAPCGRAGVTCEELSSQGAQWGIYGLVEQQG
jgi:hypothetical protein